MPQAPATEVIASTKGVPAANIVSSVRANLAIADFSSKSPITGIFRLARSRKCWAAIERFLNSSNPKTVPPKTPNIIHQLATKKFEASIRNCVNPGKSAPKLPNNSENCGITKIIKIVTTIIAATITAAG